MPESESSTQIGDKLRRIPKVFIGLVIILLIGLIFYGVSVYKEKQKLPVLQLGGISTILHFRFHADGVFPQKIRVVLKPENKYLPIDDNTFERDNYVFRYHRINGKQAVIWATPKGELRKQGYTYFILFTPQTVITWRGPVQEPSESSIISEIPVPDYPLLSRLGMGEIDRRPINSATTN